MFKFALIVLVLGAACASASPLQNSVNTLDKDGGRTIEVSLRDGSTRAYYFTASTYSWTSARDYCKSRSQDLIKIETSAEQEGIIKAMAIDGSYDNRWINILYTASGWIWGSGDAATYTNFYAFSMSTSYRHYVVGTAAAPYFNKWNYASSTGNLKAICE